MHRDQARKGPARGRKGKVSEVNFFLTVALWPFVTFINKTRSGGSHGSYGGGGGGGGKIFPTSASATHLSPGDTFGGTNGGGAGASSLSQVVLFPSLHRCASIYTHQLFSSFDRLRKPLWTRRRRPGTGCAGTMSGRPGPTRITRGSSNARHSGPWQNCSDTGNR